ncbi:sulfatase-like hydrolase/transferase, partial [bacterium]|nr:sulfatase-like hydrolase/transferase [bacterium]
GLERALLRPVRRTPPRRTQGPPNLVLVGVDTLRHDHATAERMPDVAALARGGIVLDDVTASSPWTLPSFSGALTGLMPGLHGAGLRGDRRNMDRQVPERLDAGATTLAQHLARHGYETAAFYANQFFAFGLAESFGSHRYLNLSAGDMLAVAADWIARHRDRPFCCFVLLNDPHEPTTPPPDLLARELDRLDEPPATVEELHHLATWGDPTRPEAHLGLCGWPLPDAARRARRLKLAIYRATVRQVDRALGRLADRLERLGLADQTVCTVFSDHGEEFCEHAAEAHAWNHDPRAVRGIGHGHTQFQELLRVPWISWGPGVPAAGTIARPASLLDLAPTMVDWLGLDPLPLPTPAMPGLVGEPYDGDGDPSERLLLAEATAFGPDVVALRRGGWKLIAHRDGRPLGLYDLAADPHERDDLQSVADDRVRQFQDTLASWRDAMADHRPGGDGATRGWADLDDEVRRRLKDLGYGE